MKTQAIKLATIGALNTAMPLKATLIHVAALVDVDIVYTIVNQTSVTAVYDIPTLNDGVEKVIVEYSVVSSDSTCIETSITINKKEVAHVLDYYMGRFIVNYLINIMYKYNPTVNILDSCLRKSVSADSKIKDEVKIQESGVLDDLREVLRCLAAPASFYKTGTDIVLTYTNGVKFIIQSSTGMIFAGDKISEELRGLSLKDVDKVRCFILDRIANKSNIREF